MVTEAYERRWTKIICFSLKDAVYLCIVEEEF